MHPAARRCRRACRRADFDRRAAGRISRVPREWGLPRAPTGGTPSGPPVFSCNGKNRRGFGGYHPPMGCGASPLAQRARQQLRHAAAQPRHRSMLEPTSTASAPRLPAPASTSPPRTTIAATTARASPPSTQLAHAAGTPLVATGDVLYHAAHRRPLADVLAAIREGTTVASAGTRLPPTPSATSSRPREMARLFRGHEHALARTLEIADACRFSLDELVYEYPDEPVPAGKTAQGHLEDLTWEGARARFPEGIPDKVAATLDEGARADRPAFLRALLPHRARHRRLRARARHSCARAAARPPTRPSATASASPP